MESEEGKFLGFRVLGFSRVGVFMVVYSDEGWEGNYGWRDVVVVGLYCGSV